MAEKVTELRRTIKRKGPFTALSTAIATDGLRQAGWNPRSAPSGRRPLMHHCIIRLPVSPTTFPRFLSLRPYFFLLLLWIERTLQD